MCSANQQDEVYGRCACLQRRAGRSARAGNTERGVRRHDTRLQHLDPPLPRLRGRLRMWWRHARLRSQRRLRPMFGQQHDGVQGRDAPLLLPRRAPASRASPTLTAVDRPRYAIPRSTPAAPALATPNAAAPRPPARQTALADSARRRTRSPARASRRSATRRRVRA